MADGSTPPSHLSLSPTRKGKASSSIKIMGIQLFTRGHHSKRSSSGILHLGAKNGTERPRILETFANLLVTVAQKPRVTLSSLV